MQGLYRKKKEDNNARVKEVERVHESSSLACDVGEVGNETDWLFFFLPW
jgi:hypothetical protein